MGQVFSMVWVMLVGTMVWASDGAPSPQASAPRAHDEVMSSPSATPAPAPKEVVQAEKIAPKALVVETKAKVTATPVATAKAVSKKETTPLRPIVRQGDTKALFSEARALLVANQKYVLRFEEEGGHSYSTEELSPVTTTFSEDEVKQFQTSVDSLTQYVFATKAQCQGASTRYLAQALEKYGEALNTFNRKALPIVGDISENNNVMVLIVNKTALRDAPVLVSRYFQFKKQRFKESLAQFVQTDSDLVSQLVNIARLLKTDISSEDWNRAYSVRENALELVSIWPRRTIFDATSLLAQTREPACIVKAPVAE